MAGLTLKWFTLLAFASSVATGATEPPTWDYHRCFSFIASIPLSNATVSNPAYAPFDDSYSSIHFLNQFILRNGDTSDFFNGTSPLNEAFDISFTYCSPKEGASTLQILTHGLGFDKSYWDFYPPFATNRSYSYTSAALEQGHAVLFYDRLGIGLSAKPDPYKIIQAPIHLSILVTLTSMARSGTLHSDIPLPKKVVHVGHSYGSTLTNAFAAAAPQLSDGIILTGFSNNLTWEKWLFSTTGHLASENQPERFSGVSGGWVTWPDKYSNQYSFLSYPHFDKEVLTYAESTKWPFAVGEISTSKSLKLVSSFNGPVLFFGAGKDLVFCGGDCTSIIAKDPVQSIRFSSPASIASGLVSPTNQNFANASSVDVYLHPDVGHAINLHYNSTAAFGVMLDWIEKNVVA